MPSFPAYSCSHKVQSDFCPVQDCRVKLARPDPTKWYITYDLALRSCQQLRSEGSRKVTRNAIKIFEKTPKIITIEKIQDDMITITARGTEVSAKFPPIFRRTCSYVRISKQRLNHVVLIIPSTPLHIAVCIGQIRKSKKFDARARARTQKFVEVYLCNPRSKINLIRLIRKPSSCSIIIRHDCSCKVLNGEMVR